MSKESLREWRLQKYKTEYKPAYDSLMKFYPLSLDDLEGERWRVIPGYENYQVSDYGRIKSFANSAKGKILRPSLSAYGYLLARLFKNDIRKEFRINRLVAEAFIPNPENKPEVNHLHGRFNNFFGSLEWATGSENQRHAVKTGLKSSGESNYNAKLTTEQVLYIIKNPDNLTGRELAQKFGVPPQRISKIRLRQSWRNIDEYNNKK